MIQVSSARARSCGAAGLVVLLLVGVIVVSGAPTAKKRPYTTWSAFGGTPDSMQYSALTHINRSNVSQLEQVWFYPAVGRAEFAFSPLIVGKVMYVAGKGNRSVVALNAATGQEIWTHPTEGTTTDRGYAYWESKDGNDQRIIFSVNNLLQQVNAKTGATITSFGKDGYVDLREGLGRDPKTIRRIQSKSPGHVFENLIILGSASGEGYDDPPGWLRAYDVLTGKPVWTFHTVPLPGEYGYETWPPDAYKWNGGANTWSNFSIDEKRGIAYFPTGSPTYDYYGGRRPGMNLFGNSILALDARTGRRLWHFQVIHHDIWDLDLCTEPKLLTVRHKGKMVDVVAVPSKSGLLFVFNRVTGEPLWPIEERPVPKSDVPGEEAWPTQPFPTKPPPISRLTLTPEDVSPYIDAAGAERFRKAFETARYEGIYTPWSVTRGAITFPGVYGGAGWGAAAGDPQTGMVYVRAENFPTGGSLTERAPRSSAGTPEQQGRAIWNRLCASCHTSGAASLESLKGVPPDRIRTVVREGSGPMPSLGPADLDDQGMTRLLAYIANPAAAVGQLPSAAAQHAPGDTPPPLPNGELRRYYPGGPGGGLGGAGVGRLPLFSPPYSEIVAFDLNEGTVKWRSPLGVIPELAAKGITNTGSWHPDRNGITVTAGGLIFMGTLGDAHVRAFDKDNGKVLWEKKMESNPEGIPSIYEVDGRQYVAFFLHSNGEPSLAGPGNPEAQGYYVFALPRTVKP